MWDDLVAWFQSPGGARVLQTAIIPALAILVAGVIAALIGRGAVRALLARSERVEAAGAIAGLVEAARAAADLDADRGQRRRAARLRTEADVRTRLLPMPGAALAADWAAERTDALRSREADVPASADLNELRDRLIAWTRSPGRAKRIFTAPTTSPTRPSADAEAASAANEEPGRSTRALEAEQEAPQPVRATDPTPSSDAAGQEAAGRAIAATPASDGEALPAWQRTRAMERLQQERAARGRPVEAPRDSDREDDASLDTAPVLLQHAHRAQGAPMADADEAVRLEAHQQARHARPEDSGAPAATAAPAPAPAASVPSKPESAPLPAWLDTYDDEAQVTQNLDLKTPPPVAAASVRGRGGTGDDLVPRS